MPALPQHRQRFLRPSLRDPQSAEHMVDVGVRIDMVGRVRQTARLFGELLGTGEVAEVDQRVGHERAQRDAGQGRPSGALAVDLRRLHRQALFVIGQRGLEIPGLVMDDPDIVERGEGQARLADALGHRNRQPGRGSPRPATERHSATVN